MSHSQMKRDLLTCYSHKYASRNFMKYDASRNSFRHIIFSVKLINGNYHHTPREQNICINARPSMYENGAGDACGHTAYRSVLFAQRRMWHENCNGQRSYCIYGHHSLCMCVCGNLCVEIVTCYPQFVVGSGLWTQRCRAHRHAELNPIGQTMNVAKGVNYAEPNNPI